MNFQSLVYFKTVAELQHYTKAASTLFITQPALSKAIHNLEVELGVTLFQKEGRNVTLTPSGAAFYEYVKRAVDEINNGIAAVQHRADVERNIIFVSALFSNYTEFLPEKIAQFRKMNPHLPLPHRVQIYLYHRERCPAGEQRAGPVQQPESG